MALLFSGRGGGSIGLWFSGSWPFAKLEIFDDKIVLSMLFLKAEIPPNAVRYIERLGKIPIVADGIYLEIDGPDLPSSITYFGFTDGDEVEEVLRRICKHLGTRNPWYKNPFNVSTLIALPIITLIILSVLFQSS